MRIICYSIEVGNEDEKDGEELLERCKMK